MGNVRGAAGRTVLAVAAVAVLAAGPDTAAAFDARLGWSPVQSVAGYRLYMRQSGQMYGNGGDLGLLLSDPDGVVRYIVHGLPNGVVTSFAVTAYDLAGRESALSNELSLLVTATATATQTGTPPPSLPPSASASPSRSPTATGTPPPIASATATRTPTALPDATPTPTPSPTADPGSGFGVRGRISYFAGSVPVPAATVTLQDGQGALATTTDSLGQFLLAGVPAGAWLLQPQKQGDFRHAVSALDAAYVLEAVSGLRNLDPLAALACDVTGDGTLSALDAARILQFDAGLIDHLPVAQTCGSDWIFVPQPLSAPLEQLVWPQLSNTRCQPGGIVFEPLQSEVAQQDFAAALFGDCTGNWKDSGSAAALRLRSEAVQTRLGVAYARPGRRWVVPLYVQGRNLVQALTAHVSYDPADAELQVVRLVGVATGAMMHYRADNASGRAAIALASGQPLDTERPLARLVFRAASAPQVQLLDATVDEAIARVAD